MENESTNSFSKISRWNGSSTPSIAAAFPYSRKSFSIVSLVSSTDFAGMSPEYSDFKDHTMYQEVCSKWSSQSNKNCIITETSSYAFSWIQEQIEFFDSFLTKNNPCSDPPVRILLIEENSIFAIIILLYCAKKNILCAPISPSLTEEQIELQKNIITPDIIITTPGIGDKFSTNGTALSYELESTVHQVKFCRGKVKKKNNKTNLIMDHSSAFLLTTTSGSTGSPKPVAFTQKTKLIRAISAISYWKLASNDVIINASPIHSSLGQRLIIVSLLCGAKCILLRKFTKNQWLELGKRHGLTFSIPVTSHLEVLSESPLFWELLSSENFKGLVSSSSYLNKHLKQQLIDKLKDKFYEMYGASEIGTATVLNGSEATAKAASVGKALPGIEIKILNDEGKIKEKMELGEIAVRTNCIFSGYYKLPEQTEKSILDGYFLTGDLGYIDNDGYIYFKSRKKEVIKSGGYSIYCSDIEECVQSLEYVKHCKALPTKYPLLGDVAIVFAELQSDLWMINNEKFSRQIRGYCAKNMASYQVPHKIFIIKKMPRLRNDKTDIRALKLLLDSYSI